MQLNPGIMQFEVQVNWERAAQTLVATLPAAIVKSIREKALLETSAKIVATAKQLVPTDTYALKQSIRAQWSPHNKLKRTVTAKGGAGGRTYALFVEYGRKKLNRRDAQPFLRPALHSHIITFKEAMRASVNEAIQKISHGRGSSGIYGSTTATRITDIAGILFGGGAGIGGGGGEGGEVPNMQIHGRKALSGRKGKSKKIGYGLDLDQPGKHRHGRRGKRGH